MKIASTTTLLVALALALGCAEQDPNPSSEYLIRIRDSVVTVSEFNRFLEIARAAYPQSALKDRETIRILQQRVLRELAEQALFHERAKELNITVTDDDVENALMQIQSDFPDTTFEDTLLEQAVSISAWKEGLKSRLLIEKVIARDLVAPITISAEDIAEYYRNHQDEYATESDSAPAPEIEETIIRNLRRLKAEEAYSEYVQMLHNRYPIDINTERWRRIIGS